MTEVNLFPLHFEAVSRPSESISVDAPLDATLNTWEWFLNPFSSITATAIIKLGYPFRASTLASVNIDIWMAESVYIWMVDPLSIHPNVNINPRRTMQKNKSEQ